ncbi:MAG: hypothetical protein LBK54_08815 [Propionibacteriaceae bacterium]|jgi:hypothetical protein|nr:hypothetical protein [Propionibacteriaceae bacterium]
MAVDPERSGNRKIDDDQIKKAQQRAKEEKEARERAEKQRQLAAAAIRATKNR